MLNILSNLHNTTSLLIKFINAKKNGYLSGLYHFQKLGIAILRHPAYTLYDGCVSISTYLKSLFAYEDYLTKSFLI